MHRITFLLCLFIPWHWQVCSGLCDDMGRGKSLCTPPTEVVCSDRPPSFHPLGFRAFVLLVSSIPCVYFPVYYLPGWQRRVSYLHSRSRSSLRRTQCAVESPSQIGWKEYGDNLCRLVPFHHPYLLNKLTLSLLLFIGSLLRVNLIPCAKNTLHVKETEGSRLSEVILIYHVSQNSQC